MGVFQNKSTHDASSRIPRAQPIPQVNAKDVKRIVRRDFQAEELAALTAILGEYGSENWHREISRVQLAALKVANGSMTRLRACIESAKRDYRDVLAAAEYPAYCKIGVRIRELSEDERIKIIESDWQQYESWLNH